MSEAAAAFYSFLRTDVLPIRPSQYDISNTCNLFCEGCLFYVGDDYKGHPEVRSPARVEAFFAGEAARGVNYAEVAGAEPSLKERSLLIMARHIPRGVAYTNGVRKITAELPYRLQVSLWGLPEQSVKLRGADVVSKQARNYRDDPRAIFVFTITGQNVGSIPEMVRFCADHGLRLTFNHFSPTRDYVRRLGSPEVARDGYFRFSDRADNLLLDREQLSLSRDFIGEALEDHPTTVIYSHAFNDWVHDPDGLYTVTPETGVALDCGSRLTSIYRHFHADLTDAGEVKCPTPNLDCANCRLYAQALGTLLQRLTRSALRGKDFERWIEIWRMWCLLFWGDPPRETQAAPHVAGRPQAPSMTPSP